MNPTPTINIGGEDRPIYYGMSAMAELEKSANIPLSDIANLMLGNSLDITLQIAFLGLKYGASFTGEKFTQSKDQVAFWIDEKGLSCLAEFMEIFVSDVTRISGVDIKQEKKPAKKKRQPSKRQIKPKSKK